MSLAALGGAALLIGVAELIGEGATLTSTDRIGKRRSVLIGLLVSAVSFALLVPWGGTMGPGLALLAAGIMGFEFTIVSSFPLASEIAPDGRSRYLSLTVVALGIGRAIGAGVGPVLFGAVGLVGPVAVAVIADLAAAALLLVWITEVPDPTSERPA